MTTIKTQSPRDDTTGDSPSRDDVLKRMLKMPPKPHSASKPLAAAKKAPKRIARKG